MIYGVAKTSHLHRRRHLSRDQKARRGWKLGNRARRILGTQGLMGTYAMKKKKDKVRMK